MSEKDITCCICGRVEVGEKYGHNSEPVMTGHCCSDCNMNVVIPRRMEGDW